MLLRQAGRHADVQHAQPAHPLRAWEPEHPGLGVAQGRSDVGSGAGWVGLAGVGVQAGGQIQRQQQRAAGPDPGLLQPEHRLPHCPLQRAGAPRAKNGVDDQPRAGEQPGQRGKAVVVRSALHYPDSVRQGQAHLGVGRGSRRHQVAGYFCTPAAQVAGGDQAVGPVVARPGQREHVRSGDAAQHLAGRPGHRQPRVLHQRIGADARPLRCLFDCRHLGGGDDLHAGSSLRSTTKATAYSREWDRLTEVSSTPRRCARDSARPW